MRLVALTVLSLLLSVASSWAQSSGDPCALMPKSNVAIAITSATTTSLIPPAIGSANYICGVNLVQGSGTTIQFEYGTGATCGTGTQAMSGIIPAPPIVFQLSTPTMNATQMVTPVSQRVCAVSTGTNGIHGYLSYVSW